MTNDLRSPLAIHGGTPIRTHDLPNAIDGSGRTFGSEEEEAVLRTLRTGRLWRVSGSEVDLFEDEFAAAYGSRHAVASSSGTAALHTAISVLGLQPGDEVIVPPITDMGTIIGVLACNAIPVFADVDDTGCLTLESIAQATTVSTRAVILVHLFGRAAPARQIAAHCAAEGITLIEDCAQAYLSFPEGEDLFVGRFGAIGCFSLQQSKHISAGEGGICITDDDELAAKMRLFTDKGWPRASGVRQNISYGVNYRMPELTAAVARAQLPKLAHVVERRRESGTRVAEAIENLSGLSSVRAAERPGHSYWLLPVLVDAQTLGCDATEFSAALTAEGIPALPGYLPAPLYENPFLREHSIDGRSHFPWDAGSPAGFETVRCSNAERLISADLLVLPCNERFSTQDTTDIIEAVRKVHAHFVSA